MVTNNSLPNFIPKNGNLGLGYRGFGFDVRVQAVHRSRYLKTNSATPSLVAYQRPKTTWNLKTRYALARNLSVFVDLDNITSEPLDGIYALYEDRVINNRNFYTKLVAGIDRTLLMSPRLPTPMDVALVSVFLAASLPALSREALLGHWPLAGDARDHSGQNRHGTVHDVDFSAAGPDGRRGGAAAFDGRRSWIEVPGRGLPLGRGDFTIAVRVHTEEILDDLPGDILSQYDPVARRGVNFGILSLPGSTTSQPNERNVHFGIDNGKLEPAWTDHGRPGHTVKLFGMAVYDGNLYAATCERGPEELGRVYRLDRQKGWIDCGTPDRCNAVSSLAIFQGQLYAATARYRLKGSGLPETNNPSPGGNVYRYQGGNRWEFCGRVSGETEAIFGFVVFRGAPVCVVRLQTGRAVPL